MLGGVQTSMLLQSLSLRRHLLRGWFGCAVLGSEVSFDLIRLQEKISDAGSKPSFATLSQCSIESLSKQDIPAVERRRNTPLSVNIPPFHLDDDVTNPSTFTCCEADTSVPTAAAPFCVGYAARSAPTTRAIRRLHGLLSCKYDTQGR